MTTIHCPTCSGVQTMTAGGGPVHVRWCECPPAPDPRDAEIARLRALVREAWEEGNSCGEAGQYLWDQSETKKALD